MIHPSPDQLALLSPVERMAFAVGDRLHRSVPQWLIAYNRVIGSSLAYGSGGRRIRTFGLEKIAHLDAQSSILFVANHRSRFDFFALTAVIYWKTKLSKRILFPVRSTFFYDHPLGPILNLAMSGMSMFPPVMRDPKKALFNTYTLDRCVAELAQPATIMGLHPEGRRNPSPDPYSFLPARPGVGKVILHADNAYVVPVYIVGVGNQLGLEVLHNWMRPARFSIDLCFGSPIDFSDLRQKRDRATHQLRASQRCMDAIRLLAEEHRTELSASNHAKKE